MNPSDSNHPKIGIVAGILAASMMALLSISTGHEPETVLFRTVVGGVLLGFLAATLTPICSWLLSEDEDEF